MKSTVLISVIIPAYNASKTLLLTLDSLEKSKFNKEMFEVILVNDGSTDNTKDLVDQFKIGSNMQLNYLQQKNLGSGAARNVGIKNAKGKILAFTDADCIVDENWLSEIKKAIEIEGNIIIGGLTYTDEVSIFPWKIAPVGSECVMTGNLAVNYDQVRGVMFNEEFKLLGEDTDFAFQIRNLGYELKHIAEMKVNHPPHIYNLRQMIRRLFYREYEVLLYKKYKKEISSSFSPLFRPCFCRLSPITILFTLLLDAMFLAVWMDFVLLLLVLSVISLYVYLTRLYKYLIISNNGNVYISISDRLKTLMYFSIYVPLFIFVRIVGSIKFRFVMI